MTTIHKIPNAARVEDEASRWIARLEADDVSADDRARFAAWRDATEARDLLAEANLVLANTQMNRMTRDRFWETLEEELDSAGENLTPFKDPKAAAAFAAVVAAARARIARYRAQPEGESSSTG